MENQIKAFVEKHGRYPTSNDFRHYNNLPALNVLKRRYKNKTLNVILAEILGTPSYADVLLEYVAGRDKVFFRARDIVKDKCFTKRSFARWLCMANIDGYELKRTTQHGLNGYIITKKR